ncbi:sulfatase maturation enzyme AslB (radical SAM superfamily) [Streptomyces turgidiscabies]|uniref:Sulfatase maturation enzyme AslB (Radical SAM superfamily) n=1 Tax=Streptomyces turgidiscabies TaxID=85558 RepID=A0ABU0S0C4_9ACTN|nr:sulfatase maturation enzyme AslB (radical SAM superfamily) [Streptomyces turgidiscabies]
MPMLSQGCAGGVAHSPEPAPWPLAILDVTHLRRRGLRAVPLRQFTLKVHSRCNLSCSYCYIYHGSDGSWRDHPPRVLSQVMRRTAGRIAEHVVAHGLTDVRVDFHGGEPLLSGPDILLEYLAAIRAAVPATCATPATVQTNGTLLTERVLLALAKAGIRVGLSLDGGAPELNRRRVDHAGRPSWPAVERAARLLTRHPQSYAGLLCTIDLEQDPVAVYRSLVALGPPSLDLLLPHANWSSPPPGLPMRAHQRPPGSEAVGRPRTATGCPSCSICGGTAGAPSGRRAFGSSWR